MPVSGAVDVAPAPIDMAPVDIADAAPAQQAPIDDTLQATAAAEHPPLNEHDLLFPSFRSMADATATPAAEVPLPLPLPLPQLDLAPAHVTEEALQIPPAEVGQPEDQGLAVRRPQRRGGLEPGRRMEAGKTQRQVGATASAAVRVPAVAHTPRPEAKPVVAGGEGEPEKRTSRFRGVRWRRKNWQAELSYRGKNIHLGSFEGTEEGEIAAARAYDEKAREVYGKHDIDHVNFLLDGQRNPQQKRQGLSVTGRARMLVAGGSHGGPWQAALSVPGLSPPPPQQLPMPPPPVEESLRRKRSSGVARHAAAAPELRHWKSRRLQDRNQRQLQGEQQLQEAGLDVLPPPAHAEQDAGQEQQQQQQQQQQGGEEEHDAEVEVPEAVPDQLLEGAEAIKMGQRGSQQPGAGDAEQLPRPRLRHAAGMRLVRRLQQRLYLHRVLDSPCIDGPLAASLAAQHPACPPAAEDGGRGADSGAATLPDGPGAGSDPVTAGQAYAATEATDGAAGGRTSSPGAGADCEALTKPAAADAEGGAAAAPVVGGANAEATVAPNPAAAGGSDPIGRAAEQHLARLPPRLWEQGAVSEALVDQLLAERRRESADAAGASRGAQAVLDVATPLSWYPAAELLQPLVVYMHS